MYKAKAQSFDNPRVYQSWECDDIDTWVEIIVSIAQTRRRGTKMRLMAIDYVDSDIIARFDVQYTKTE